MARRRSSLRAPRGASTRPPGRASRRTLAVLLGAALGVACGEVGARVLAPLPSHVAGMVFDPLLGFRMPSNVDELQRDERGPFRYATNSLGYPGPELPEALPAPGTLRLLFVGDSFLVNWHVRAEAMLPFATRDRLNAAGVPVESFVLASNNWGTGQELLDLDRRIDAVGPHVVILVMYPSNDVSDDSLALVGETAGSPGAYVRPFVDPGVSGSEGELAVRYLHPVRAWFRARSRLFAHLELRWLEHHPWRPQPTRPLDPARRVQLDLPPLPALMPLWELPPTDPWERAWSRTEALVQAFADRVRAAGAQLVVAVVPHALQVQSDERARALQQLDAGHGTLARIDWNRSERRLLALGERAGFPVVPFVASLRQATREEGRTMYKPDRHLNARGHAVAAGALSPWLLALARGASRPPPPVPEGAPVELAAPPR